MKSESEVQQLIQIEGPQHNCVLMRNNSGCFKDSTGRLVRFGLGNISNKYNDRMKSSDLIGVTSMVISPDMVGKTIAVFTAIEVKAEGWGPPELSRREIAQNNFVQWIRKQGGIAGFASSILDFKRLLEK